MMKIQPARFNTYLTLALLLLVPAGMLSSADKPDGSSPTNKPFGKTEPRKKKDTKLSTLRLHLEAQSDGSARTGPVPIMRSDPMLVNVEKAPFLNEAMVVSAAVIESAGGFEIKIQLDRQGTWLLENITTDNRGRRIAIFSQFTDTRWLAAPKIERRITDGVLTFTPDATKEEAQRIVKGLNEVAKKAKKGQL